MNKTKIEFTNERIIWANVLAGVGAIFGKSDFVKQRNRMDVTSNRSQHQIKNGDILRTYIELLTVRKPAYESVDIYQVFKLCYSQKAMSFSNSYWKTTLHSPEVDFRPLTV